MKLLGYLVLLLAFLKAQGFDGSFTLDPAVWNGFNSPNMDVVDGCLEILAAGNMWNAPSNNGVPRVYRSLPDVNGDFTVRVGLDCGDPPHTMERYNDLGVFLRIKGPLGDEDNAFYRFSVYTDADYLKYNFFVGRVDGDPSPKVITQLNDNTDFPDFIEVQRIGSKLHFSFGSVWADQMFDITPGDELDAVGMFAATGGRPITDYYAAFNNFVLTIPPPPVPPEPLDMNVWSKFNAPDAGVVDGCIEIPARGDMWKTDTPPGNNQVPRIYQSLPDVNGDFVARVELTCGEPPYTMERYNDLGIFVRIKGPTGDTDNAFYRFSVFTDGDKTNYNLYVTRVVGEDVFDIQRISNNSVFPEFIVVERIGNQLHYNFGGIEIATYDIAMIDELDAVGLFGAVGDEDVEYTASFINFSLMTPGGMVGDPHVITLAGQWFDYHGECDLVLAHVPQFVNDQSLDLHVRTTIRYSYSFISTAALRIGEDVLEVSGYGDYAFNGVASASLADVTLNGFPIQHTQINKKRGVFDVLIVDSDGGMHGNITFTTFKDLVAVKISPGAVGHFKATSGLMGSFDGSKLARDHITVMPSSTQEDINVFGQEWQVRQDDPQLFQSIRVPQQPKQQCILPSNPVASQRRLGETRVSRKDAEGACSTYYAGPRFENCVVDVLALGETDLAGVGAY